MDTIWHYTSLAAGSIAHEQGWLDDSDRVKRLAYAMYEAAIRQVQTHPFCGHETQSHHQCDI
jgi:hypothetical protein